jgi:hypothetical protein
MDPLAQWRGAPRRCGQPHAPTYAFCGTPARLSISAGTVHRLGSCEQRARDLDPDGEHGNQDANRNRL